MIIHLAPPAGRIQVGATGQAQGQAPTRDAGPGELAAQGAKLADAAQVHDECSDDGRKGDYSEHMGKNDHSKAGKDDYSRHGKDAKNDDGEPHKDDCQPEKDFRDPKPSDDCRKGDTYRNPGEALAKIDFSGGDFGS